MSRKIGILDYGMGNIRSVYNALDHLGYEAEVVSEAAPIESCSHLIIPGVGSYAMAMANMAELDLLPAICKHVDKGRPLLGICLGMQILSQTGEEGGHAPGLGLIPGKVVHLRAQKLPVPHVGWNALAYCGDHPVFSRIKKHVDFYFVHSYCFKAANPATVLATSDYAQPFAAVVGHRNVIGMQFHPEKSQDNGLLLLENFCEWSGEC